MTSSVLLAEAVEGAAERDDAIRHKGTEKVQGMDGGVFAAISGPSYGFNKSLVG